MQTAIVTSWADANQRYLTARLALVREALERHAARANGDAAAAAPESSGDGSVGEAAGSLPSPAALDILGAAFSLSPFERDALVLCAGMELDASFAALCAAAHGSSQRPYPTFSLALATLPEPHWSALTPAAPLRHWRLLEVLAGDTLTTSALRIDERVLHFLAGVSYLDERLMAMAALQRPPNILPASHRMAVERTVGTWARPGGEDLPVIHLAGSDGAACRTVAAAGCAALGMQLFAIHARDVTGAADRDALLRLWERETVLSHCAVLIDCDETDRQRSDLSFLDHTRSYVLVAGEVRPQTCQRRVARIEIDKLGTLEQQALWLERLGPLAETLDGHLEALVSQFDLRAEEIRTASEDALAAAPGDRDDLARRLWNSCRGSVRPALDDLAQRIDCVASWSDLVLPAGEHQTLRDIATQVRHRRKVYVDWGFAAKSTRGLGLSALFGGASGTGKTIAAEVLARELRLDLYRIDLSQVVSKYIGETEKNLRRVFDAAEAGGAVLLFDEADALFGKRSEVRDSHDRYANVEISYLLQRMESYRGLAILTTNMRTALDGSFLRRMRFVVQFPFPDATLRAEIWRRVFPPQTPVDSLDVSKLARLNIAGGNIRNIALQSAFLAAEMGEPVRMRHVLRAARSEYAKLDKQLTEGEIRDWV
jgi:hypothetical protein